MKQNKYDEQIFFEKYSQMDRSQKGLSGAGEWNTLKDLLPNFKDKRVLDLGCGYGWHCIYALEQGATATVGIDISYKMLEVAKAKTSLPNAEYIQLPIEDIDFPANSFDVVISSLAFHYLESFETIAKKVNNCLKPGGTFIFSVEHPIFTAYGNQDWFYDEDGKILHFPVDNYFTEGKRDALFLGADVIKYHKTLTTYVNGLLQNGFVLTNLVEPKPSPELIAEVAAMKDELRRPMILILKATKK